MTPEELKDVLARLGMAEGVPHEVNPKKVDLSKEGKVGDMIGLLESMKELFQREILEEEAKIVALREKSVKTKKGGCNG